jgi:hypothetical protein
MIVVVQKYTFEDILIFKQNKKCNILMDLCEIGKLESKEVTIFSVNKKQCKSKEYGCLEDIATDFITGISRIENTQNQPSIILIFEGDSTLRDYFKKSISEKGYYSLAVDGAVPQKHPGKGVYIIQLDYFLDKLINPVVA